MKNRILAMFCAALLLSTVGCAGTVQPEGTESPAPTQVSDSVQNEKNDVLPSDSPDAETSVQDTPSPSPNQTQTVSDAQQKQIYAPILEKYTAELTGSAQDWGDDSIDYFLHQYNAAQVGYIYTDINQDGIDELIIGSNEDGEYGTFLALYTIDDDNALLITQYMDPYTPNLCIDGTISVECFMAGNQMSYSFSKLGANGLTLIDEICFSISDGAWSRVSGDDFIDISTGEAENILGSYPHEALHFTPFLTASELANSNHSLDNNSNAPLSFSEISMALAEWIPNYVAVADDYEVQFDDETQKSAVVQVKLKAANEDAFTVTGYINIGMVCLDNGAWFAEVYETQCDIVYNYAGEYYDDPRCLIGYWIESSVQIGGGVAMLDVMPLDFVHGGSDPTGEKISCYLEGYTGPLDNAIFALETWDKSTQIPLDAQMKPLMYQSN